MVNVSAQLSRLMWCAQHAAGATTGEQLAWASETLMYAHQLKVITHGYCKGSKPPKYKSMQNSNKQLLMYHQWLLKSGMKEQITEKLYIAIEITMCNQVAAVCSHVYMLCINKSFFFPPIFNTLRCFQDELLQGIKSASLDIYHSPWNIVYIKYIHASVVLSSCNAK